MSGFAFSSSTLFFLADEGGWGKNSVVAMHCGCGLVLAATVVPSASAVGPRRTNCRMG
jgi:hypothetical protein